mgnify:CR=1 FL=1
MTTNHAVFFVDLQQNQFDPRYGIYNADTFLAQMTEALAEARQQGDLVIHIQHDAGPGTPYDVSARIGHIADIVAGAVGALPGLIGWATTALLDGIFGLILGVGGVIIEFSPAQPIAGADADPVQPIEHVERTP